MEGIIRGRVSLLCIPHPPKCLYSLLVYIHRIKRLEGYMLTILLLHLGDRIMGDVNILP